MIIIEWINSACEREGKRDEEEERKIGKVSS